MKGDQRALAAARSPTAALAAAKSPLPRVLAFAEERGWRRLRLLSSAANTYITGITTAGLRKSRRCPC
jgi:predicted dithiol-disulfide oxidoreductase (DUF899 family)